ncbi:hypothetical protein G7B40_029750 [Aetokthonos hydrillicola Thurmond2011]|uniref:Uncharacterized protein n=1 Tax=Aetokthonos hydrillicola Thurmond2011 TaxID=2712845 RepID=A0AAP5IC53_9CYAN|nr:hypothetical protein [Aetokthonos hydrillicola]MBO3461961.1 hypothetical protein [Aetokthonos hydrillicola CCALA 1050]MBW4589153.1 hypothetical protein [Aetokthonos hydrillicola CCALA 1050]MDR9898711.1 hypothetical protein [Aetokthonos hydrillicola Thurmond2011]
MTRFTNRGDISFVGRKTLDALRDRLGLSQTQATAIEDEILADARQEFQKKLQQYEQDFGEALQQEVALSTEELDTLRQNLQQILGLRNEDTVPIESRLSGRIEAYKQHLQEYDLALAVAMRQEYPLSQATRDRFQQMQQEWQLSNEDVASIESLVTSVHSATPEGEDWSSLSISASSSCSRCSRNARSSNSFCLHWRTFSR